MMPTSSLIIRHRSDSGGQKSEKSAPKARDTTVEAVKRPEPVQDSVDVASESSTRRTAKALAVDGFVKDVLEGLTSEFFISVQNIELNAERSFDPEVADFLKSKMRDKNCTFNQARLELIRMRMRQNNIDPDTGLPLDAKALTPGMRTESLGFEGAEDAIRNGTEVVVVDIAQLPSRRATLTAAHEQKAGEISKWDVGLIDQSFVNKINSFFGP